MVDGAFPSIAPLKSLFTGFKTMPIHQASSRNGYIVVGSAFIVMLSIWGTFATFGVFFNSFVSEFGWSRALTSGASSTRDLVFGIVCIFMPKICDRYGYRLVVSASGLILGLGYFLMSQLHTPWELYVYNGIIIAFGMGTYVSLLSLVAQWFEQKRGRMTAIAFSGMGMGIMVFPSLASQLIILYGWRHAYQILALVGFVLIFAAAQFLKTRPQDSKGPVKRSSMRGDNEISPFHESYGISLKEGLRTKQFWFLSAIYFFFLYMLLTVTVHIVIYAKDMGVPAGSSAGIISVIGILCVVGLNAAGNWADRIGNRVSLMMSFLLMTLSFFWLLISRNEGTLILFAILFGLAYGGVQVLFSPSVAELFGIRSHGVLLGAAAFVGTFGAVSGPVLSGYIFDSAKSYTPAFIICACMGIASIVLASRLRPLKGQGPLFSAAAKPEKSR
jgi:MFS family permease